MICYEKFEKTRPTGAMVLKRSGEQWTRGQVIVETRAEQHALVATLAARSNAVSLVHLRWRARVPTGLAVLGGRLGEELWRSLMPDRVMPWYFATLSGSVCHGYGVMTDARALSFWQIDEQGVIQDADVVGITDAVPWEFNRQWLNALARSGTATLVSAGPPARGQEQRAALREAFAVASAGGLKARPRDWTHSSAPGLWRADSADLNAQERTYDWNGPEGASPFIGP